MEKSSNVKVDFSFWEGITFPFECIYRHFKDFCYLIGSFSLFSAILMMFAGRGFACASGLEGSIYCINNVWFSLILFVFLFILMACFVNRWWKIAFYNMSFKEAMKIKFGIADIKTMGFIFLYLMVFCAIGIGFYWLYARVVTPNWVTELLLFMLVSLFIIGGFFIIANAVVFARFLDGQEWLVFGKTFLPVFDNIYKLIAWFLFYLLLLIYLIQQAQRVFFICQKTMPLLLAGFAGDVALQFVFYLMLACGVSLLKFQERYIFGNDKN
ncbi:MAG: hypothetical protein NC218_00050 [Acetobacter sp.]|nr:hypothetical protein [Acetobacter sp.]